MTHKNEIEFVYYNIDNQALSKLSDEDSKKILSNVIYERNCDVGALFEFHESTEIISIENLLPTRCRVNGVINATSKMKEAKCGIRNKRQPISISNKKVNGKNLLLDGNSTYFVALLWGITELPCEIKE